MSSLSFLGRAIPPAFALRVVTLPVGAAMPFVEAEWRDCLVVVERGAIEAECRRAGRRRFDAGAVIWLTGLEIDAIHSVGDVPAVLSAVSRRIDPFSPTAQSGDIR